MSSSQPHKRVILGGIEYSISEADKTASVTQYKGHATEIIIPRSIKHESKEYIVTVIVNRVFMFSEVKSVSFEPNSELRKIRKNAFSFSALARIQIPAGAVELEDGWCSGTRHLIEVEVDPGNARYSSVGGKLVIGKSDIANEDYDTLVFCARDSIEANIPATIKIIGAYSFMGSALSRIQIPSHVTQICDCAFYECKQLSQFEFEPNSELRTIKKDAFSHSALARIQIPSHVTQICEGAFSSCKQLSLFEFEPNSELPTIKKDTFLYSALTSIRIPASAVELEDKWCRGTEHLIHVEVDPGNARYSSVGGKLVIGKSDIANEDYDTLVFCARDSIEANIPATIKIIGAYAFMGSALSKIKIPSHVTQICDCSFSSCKQLSQFEFEPNSELRSIGKEAFSGSALARIQIPSHVTQICERAFSSCKQLSIFEFEPNSELRSIGKYAFSYSALARIQIPSHVTQISENVFCICKQLSRFEFEPNSELRSIGEEAFSGSALASIQIPSHVTTLHDYAFYSCKQLQIVEIDEKCLDEPIYMDKFSSSKIVMFPAREKHL